MSLTRIGIIEVDFTKKESHDFASKWVKDSGGTMTINEI